jgi:lipoprotein-releasing system permease protein
VSRLPFELLLALRYLRPKRTFVSVITLISVIGVMLGVAVLIIVISVMSGFDKQLREKLLGFNAHLKIFATGQVMADHEAVAVRVAANPAVKAVAPFIVGQVLVETHPAFGDPQQIAPVVRGIDPELESKVSILPQNITQGEYDLTTTGVLVGSEFARKLGLRVGDRLEIYSLQTVKEAWANRERGKMELETPEDYEIRGIFDVGYYEYNDMFVITSLKRAQELYGFKNGEVHGVLVMLNDPNLAPAVAQELRTALGPGFEVRDWLQDNSKILDAIIVEKNVMFYILFFIMIVAAFGITSALITFVVQKTREIGVLKALGATRGQIMTIFLGQGLMVGVMGVIAGFALGLLAVHYRNQFLHFMRRTTGFQLFDESIYNFSELPALIVPHDIAIICGGSLLMCLIAGLIPAWNAGRLKPVEALRHE